MYPFEYHAVKTVEDALSMLGKGNEPQLLAGGHTLIPTMKQRLASPDVLIDISHIDALRGIEVLDGQVIVGATTTHAEVAASALIRNHIPGLSSLAGGIGDPHVRCRGTLGGSIANNDPSADYPAALLGLDSVVKTNIREIPASEFFVNLFETSLQPNEIVLSVSFSVPERSGYAKFENPASRYAIVGAFVSVFYDGSVRVAITGAGPYVFRVTEMETALVENFSASAVANSLLQADGLNEDIHASPEYRAALVTAMVQDAVELAEKGCI